MPYRNPNMRARHMATTTPPPPVAPSFTAAPVVLGIPTEGVPTSYLPGTVTGTAPITRSVQWQQSANGTTGWADLSGETGSTVTRPIGQAGNYLRIRETAVGVVSPDAVSYSAAALIVAPPGLGAGEVEWNLLGYGADPATRVNAQGYVQLQKHASAKYIFVDPVNGSNSYTGTAGKWAGSGNVGPFLTMDRALRAVYGGARDGYGDWICMSVIGDHSTPTGIPSGYPNGQTIPQGLSEQYPTVVTTYDPSLMTPGQTTPAGLRQGRWKWSNPAVSLVFNATTGIAGYKSFKWAVLEKLECVSSTKASSSLWFVGPGELVLMEDCLIKNRQLKHSVATYGRILEVNATDTLKNFCVRRCSLWKGQDQNYKSDYGVEDVMFDRCVIVGGGYSGDRRTSAGQTNPPTGFNHNCYCYGKNTRFQRCVIADGSSFGTQLRQGGYAYRNLYSRNANQLVVTGLSQDTNQLFAGLACEVVDNVFSGADHINGIDTSSGAGGKGLAFYGMSAASTFQVSGNLILNADKTIADGNLLALEIAGIASLASTLAVVKSVDVSAPTGTNVALYSSRDNKLHDIQFQRGLNLQLRCTSGAWTLQVGDTLSVSAGGAALCTVTAINELPTLYANGQLSNYDSNIQKGWGTADMLVTVSAGTTVSPVSRTNNVWDNEPAAGSNVTYASVSAGYTAPTRDAETWAVFLGYADSHDLWDYAVLHPEIDWATNGINWIRAGFNLAAV